MKKEMVKALSLGLTAATIAGSLDVPVIAAENIDGAAGGDTNITITTPTEAEKEAKVAADTDQLADDFFGDYRPVEEAEEPEGNPVENPVEEKKDDAEEGEELDDAELLNTASVTIAGQQENAIVLPDVTQEADSVVQAVADVGNEVSALIDPDVANPHTEIDAETAAEYQQILDSIDEDVDLAGEAILDAVDDTKALQAAGQAIDTAAGACTTAANAANTAAGEAESAADGAEQKTAAAITAVEKEEKEVAAQIIIEAGETLDQAKETYTQKAQDYADQKAEYDKKKEEYDNKYKEYQIALTDSKADLEDAEEELGYLLEDLGRLESLLAETREELATSAAGVLAIADTEYYSGKILSGEYIAKLAEVKVLQDKIQLEEGQTLTVRFKGYDPFEEPSYKVANVEYDICDEDGNVISTDTLKLGYSFDMWGNITLYEKQVMYEYTFNTAYGPYTERYTADQMEKLVDYGYAVRRYTKVVDGKAQYITDDTFKDLTDEEKAEYKLDYMVITSVSTSKQSEKVTDVDDKNKSTVSYFDEYGRYVQVVTDYSSKKEWVVVDGQTISVTEAALGNKTVEQYIREQLGQGEQYVQGTASVQWSVSGYYVPFYYDFYDREWKTTATEQTDPYYKDSNYWYNYKWNHWNHWNDYDYNYFGVWAISFEDACKEYNEEHTGRYAFNGYWWDGRINGATLVYYNEYLISGTVAGVKYSSKEDAIKAILKEAGYENYYNTAIIDDDVTYTEYISYKKKVQQDVDYKDTTTTTKWLNGMREKYKNGDQIVDTGSCTYVRDIMSTNAKLADYVKLQAALETAKGKADAAQKKVDDILEQIENLNRTKENWDIELLGSWDTALSNAQQNLEDAEDALERAQQNLDKAKDDYNKKYPTPIVNPNPGPNDENRDYPVPQPDELEDMPTIIPAPEVPLGGQTTTTRRARRAANTEDTIELAEAEIPLAGDTTEPETKEDEQPVATIEDDVTPLAGGESGNFLQNAWWWLLLILIAAVGGTTAYVKKVKKSDNTLK